MSNWLTSDLHFGHTNIIAYTSRPYVDVEQMNDDLVRRWNEKVTPNDEVWVLGDVCLGRLEISLMWVEQLNGIKFLVPGNHDRMFRCHGTKYLHACQKYLAAGFLDILDPEITLLIPGRKVIACHFPYAGDPKDGHEDRFQWYRPADKGGYLVHGHTHGQWRRNGRMIDVGVDAWGGYPVSISEVAELFASGNVNATPLVWEREEAPAPAEAETGAR